MRYELVAVGEVMLDVVAPEAEHGRAVHAPIAVRAGGTAVNVALAAARLGARAAVVGRVGDDAAGAAVGAGLAAAGVDALLAVDRERPTGTFLHLGAGTIVADRGANAALSPADVPAVSAAALLVSGFALGHDDSRAAAVAALARADGAWRAATAGSPALAPRVATAAPVDALFANAAEARALTGADPNDAVAALGARYRLVCVTLGADGVVGSLDGERGRRPAVTDASSGPGSGDALAAGVLVALGRGASFGEALECGSAAAAAPRQARRPAGGGRAAAP